MEYLGEGFLWNIFWSSFISGSNKIFLLGVSLSLIRFSRAHRLTQFLIIPFQISFSSCTNSFALHLHLLRIAVIRVRVKGGKARVDSHLELENYERVPSIRLSISFSKIVFKKSNVQYWVTRHAPPPIPFPSSWGYTLWFILIKFYRKS